MTGPLLLKVYAKELSKLQPKSGAIVNSLFVAATTVRTFVAFNRGFQALDQRLQQWSNNHQVNKGDEIRHARQTNLIQRSTREWRRNLSFIPASSTDSRWPNNT